MEARDQLIHRQIEDAAAEQLGDPSVAAKLTPSAAAVAAAVAGGRVGNGPGVQQLVTWVRPYMQAHICRLPCRLTLSSQATAGSSGWGHMGNGRGGRVCRAMYSAELMPSACAQAHSSCSLVASRACAAVHLPSPENPWPRKHCFHLSCTGWHVTTAYVCMGLLALQGTPQPIVHQKGGTKATAMCESTWQSPTAPCTSRGWPWTAPSMPTGGL